MLDQYVEAQLQAHFIEELPIKRRYGLDSWFRFYLHAGVNRVHCFVLASLLVHVCLLDRGQPQGLLLVNLLLCAALNCCNCSRY